ncbi:MAG: hypothetical protein ACFCGT_10065 [Sandaracinaceae bacterium]
MNDDEDLLDRLGVLVESRAVRVLLVALVIVSLLPYPGLEATLRPLFLATFGVELAIRVPLWRRRVRRGSVEPGEGAFLIVDFVALLSFLPLEQWFHRHFDALAILRLARLAVLLRFTRSLARDLFAILTRREQLQQFALVTGTVAALAFVSAVVLSQLRIGHDYDGTSGPPEGFAARLWWSFRQLESADNLVPNLDVHPLVGVLSLALTVVGVFVVSFIIGIGTNIVEQVVRSERRRPVSYSGHTVIVGPLSESETLVREFVRIYAKNRKDLVDQLRRTWRWLAGVGSPPRPGRLPRMALLGSSPEPPSVLLEPGMRWVVYRHGPGSTTDALRRIGAERAKRAILLGDPSHGVDTDAVTLSTLSAFREVNPYAHVFVELRRSRHGTLLSALEHDGHTFPLDVPRFLGLFLLHHLAVPGVDGLYRDLLTAEGSELYTHVFLDGEQVPADGGSIPFDDLAEAAEQAGVSLVGVLLGPPAPGRGPYDLIPIGELEPWLDPLVPVSAPTLRAQGARRGEVPAAALRGLIGVAESYPPLRAFARRLTQEPIPRSRSALDGEDSVTLGDGGRPPRRVVVVGFSETLVSFAQRLGQLVEAAHLIVVDEGSMDRWRTLRGPLAASGITLAPGTDGAAYEASLEGGGRLEVRAVAEGEAIDLVTAYLGAPTDALVLLAEPDAADSDARTTLRLLKLAHHAVRDESALGSDLQVLVEVVSLPRGARVRGQLLEAFRQADRPAPRVTLVSTEQVRNYFMVHSAFVPGIGAVYDRLLGPDGPEIVRWSLRTEGPVLASTLRRVARRHGLVLLAVEDEDGDLAVSPAPDARFDAPRALLAIGPRYDPTERRVEGSPAAR